MDTAPNASILVNCRAWELFADECEIDFPGNFWQDNVHIFAPNYAEARVLWQLKREKLAIVAAKWQRKLVRIFWSLNPKDRPLPVKPVNCFQGTHLNMSNIIDPINTPVAPELDISWDDCWKSQDAMWVIHQATQKVLYANPAAIAANGNKPPTEILNAEINALWEDEALDSLTRLVNRTNGWLRDHSNVGFRWQRNSESGGVIWTRSRREFHVDYHKIDYLGLECRFEHVKAAIPV